MSSAHALRQIALTVLVRAKSALILSPKALSARIEERGDGRSRGVSKEDCRLSLSPLHAWKAWNVIGVHESVRQVGDDEWVQRH